MKGDNRTMAEMSAADAASDRIITDPAEGAKVHAQIKYVSV